MLMPIAVAMRAAMGREGIRLPSRIKLACDLLMPARVARSVTVSSFGSGFDLLIMPTILRQILPTVK